MESLYLLLNLLTEETKTHLERAKNSSSRGASALEYILITLGGLAIAGIVVAAVTAFVNGKVSLLK
ncbi:hypothetical protein ACUH92_08815 [Dermabacteraceae bacterium CCM 9520]